MKISEFSTFQECQLIRDVLYHARMLGGVSRTSSSRTATVFKSQLRHMWRWKNDLPLAALWRGKTPCVWGGAARVWSGLTWSSRRASTFEMLLVVLSSRAISIASRAAWFYQFVVCGAGLWEALHHAKS